MKVSRWFPCVVVHWWKLYICIDLDPKFWYFYQIAGPGYQDLSLGPLTLGYYEASTREMRGE